ncbi:hypothetical protein HYN48_13625 [Flavobacterium magnum]|uniref:DNA mimic protein DMP19 C-terminal domain-containing protein n=1 Tax=Flavobacterium magnum TaxID=2162713 RepID=A0A2S0RIJ0_9FLAO|nr:DUF4375 domain-containing protein [Flavobacterium magnum]AWA31038.1 hypothetical protein HYN48_13625 [Flavobacterium magnum]
MMTELYDTFDKENHLKPNFDISEFETLDSWDFGWAILEPINIAADKESEKELSKRFSPGQKALYFFWYLDGEVTNGGFIQFYWNENRRYLPAILKGLKLIGDQQMVSLVENADKIYSKNREKFEAGNSQEDFEKLYNELSEFEDLDLKYFEMHDNTMSLIEKYAKQNTNEFLNLI